MYNIKEHFYISKVTEQLPLSIKPPGGNKSMMKQLSLFAQNNKGTLQDITGILKMSRSTSSAPLPMTARNMALSAWWYPLPEKAALALENAGYLLPSYRCDRSGGLPTGGKPCSHNLLLALSESNINVDYVYLSFNFVIQESPSLIFHTEGYL